jgi:apolipoprotein N-acyltransferase
VKTPYLYIWPIPATLGNIQQNQYYLAFLSLLSSVFFSLSWPPNRFVPFLFVAFVPLLLMKRHIEKHQYKRPYWTFYKYTYLALFLWNLTTTWWVAHATVAGAVFMIFVNTFCMSLPLPLFQFTARHQGQFMGSLALITYWVSMEYAHLQWELSFPWLNLGNGFACWPEWVQWYEYTGALGGTIWILVANLLLYYLFFGRGNATQWWLSRVMVSCWLVLPILCSYYMYVTHKEHGEAVEVVVVQPNINPNTGALVDRGEVLSMQERVEHLIKLSEKKLTTKTRFLVWPEIAIDGLFDEQILSEYSIIDRLVGFRQLYPQLSVLTGLNSLVGYKTEEATKTARFSPQHGYYDIFNTALWVGNQGTLATYHKSKLVPGVELVPYIYSLEVPKILTPDSRGRLSSLGMQACPSIFFNKEGIGIAPIICYESIYGGYVADFVRMGASLIFSITIDGWWKKTPGYQQHFHYTRLRAIESRRSIARSALKGISAFINQRGDILQTAQYEDQAAMRQTLQANPTLTFYVRHSNYIANTALWASLLLLIGALLGSVLTKNRQRPRTYTATYKRKAW